MEETVKTEGTPEEVETPAQEKSVEEMLLEKIETLEATIKEQNDKYLRMAAEYDNFRRRTRDEKTHIYHDALSDAVNGLLPILDNLERAALYEDGEKVKEGLAMTAKSVSAALSSLGVEIYGAVGETFDPNIHNAVMHIEDETLGDGVIVEVFQRGYRKGDKIIRFAMVKTAN